MCVARRIVGFARLKESKWRQCNHYSIQHSLNHLVPSSIVVSGKRFMVRGNEAGQKKMKLFLLEPLTIGTIVENAANDGQ